MAEAKINRILKKFMQKGPHDERGRLSCCDVAFWDTRYPLNLVRWEPLTMPA